MVEQITEVDKKDNVIGLRPRDEFYTGEYIHRSSHLILFNSKNEILIQKRAPDKKWHPNLFTFAVSGTVANESHEDCIKKETKEELGITVTAKFLFKFPLFGKFDKSFHAIFIGKSDKKIKPDKKEMTEIKWVSVNSLKEDLAKNPNKYTPPFRKGMKIYFDKFYKAKR